MTKYSLPHNLSGLAFNEWGRVPRMEAVGSAILGAFGASSTTLVTIGGTAITTGAVVGYIAVTAATAYANRALLGNIAGKVSSAQIRQNFRTPTPDARHIYGQMRVGGPIVYMETTDNNDEENAFFHMVVMLASHETEEIGQVYLNEDKVRFTDTFSNSIQDAGQAYDPDRANQSYDGYVDNKRWRGSGDNSYPRVYIKKYDGTQTSDLYSDLTAISAKPEDLDGSNFVGKGMSYLYIRLRKDTKVFAGGIPNVSAEVKGRKVYDMRKDPSSAYYDGTGSHDPDDASTWEWSGNSALCIRDYITQPHGMNDSSVNEGSFATAADNCDEDFALLTEDGTQKAFLTYGVVDTARPRGEIIEDLLSACAGTLFWTAGRWKLKVGKYTSPVKEFGLDNLRSNLAVSTNNSRRDNFNKVQGKFFFRAKEYIETDYPQVINSTYLNNDDLGEENVLDLPLPFTTSLNRARRIAKQVLYKSRLSTTIQADFDLSAVEVEVGDNVYITNDRYSWTQKVFEVVSWQLVFGESGETLIRMTLKENNSAAYSWSAADDADGEDGGVEDITYNPSIPEDVVVDPETGTVRINNIPYASGVSYPLYALNNDSGALHRFTLTKQGTGSGNVVQGFAADPYEGALYTAHVTGDPERTVINKFELDGRRGQTSYRYTNTTQNLGHQELEISFDKDGNRYFWMSAPDDTTNQARFVSRFQVADDSGDSDNLTISNAHLIQVWPDTITGSGNSTCCVSLDGRYFVTEWNDTTNVETHIRVFNMKDLHDAADAADISESYIREFTIPSWGDFSNYPLQSLASDGSFIYVFVGNHWAGSPSTRNELKVFVYTMGGTFIHEIDDFLVGFDDATDDNVSGNIDYEMEGAGWLHINGFPMLAVSIASGESGDRENRIWVLGGDQATFGLAGTDGQNRPSFLSIGTNDYGVPDGEAMRFGHWDGPNNTFTERVSFNSSGDTTITGDLTITGTLTGGGDVFKTVSVSDTDSGYTWSTEGSIVADSSTDTLTIVDGGGVAIAADATNDAIRIRHSDTSTLSGTYGSTADGTKIDQITVDEYGHVTAITTGNVSGGISNPIELDGATATSKVGSSETTGREYLYLRGDTDTTNGAWMNLYGNGDSSFANEIKMGSGGSGTTRLTVSSTGIGVTGNITVSGTVDGRDVATDGTKLDGIATNANNYSLPLASSSTRGGVKVGYTENGKNYPVELSSEKMYVNVPWTDTNTTYSTATSSTLGLVKIGYTENGKNYPVELSNGQMFVNVPWTDTNTNTNQLTTFQLEDGDGTEVTISHGKEVKFVEGTGIDINWTDTSTGSDGDPYDMTFAVTSAPKWTTARTLSLSGDATGSVSWDGSANATLSVTVADDSHNHTIANVDGLQTALDGKLSTTGKAADSNLLDGIDSGSFIRSDASDNVTGHTEWQDDYSARFGNGADFRIYHSSTNGHNYIRNFNHAAGNIYIQGENTSGTNQGLIYGRTDAARTYVQLYENSAERLRTVSDGINVYDHVNIMGNATSVINGSTTTGREILLIRGDTDTDNGGWINLYGNGDSTYANEVKMGIGGSSSAVMTLKSGQVDFNANDLVDIGEVVAGTADGGAVIRDWTGGSTYAMFGTANMTGNEYALITNGTHTYLGSGTSGTTHIRGPANDSTPEIRVTSAEIILDGTITIPSLIRHEGDTNTYMQFHANDQWRVVTNGTERFEVSANYTAIQNKIEFTYVNWDNSGTNTLRNSHQVSSVTDLATGSFRTNFSVAFAAATYAPAGMSNTSGGTNIPAIGFNTSSGTNYTTTACGHSAEDVDGGYTDYNNNCVMYVGG